MFRIQILAAVAAVGAAAAGCGSDAGDPPRTGTADSGAAGQTCERGRLEADLVDIQGDVPTLQGAGIDPSTGEVVQPASGSYVVSSTYLRLKPEADAQQRFGELMGSIIGELNASDGLIALSLATSETCGTARTFTVWESQEAMFRFVGSSAHAQAIAAVGEVSRGGSIVTSWEENDMASVGWTGAAEQLAADEGPFY